MSKAIKYNLSCSDCGSSDAYVEYDDGHGHCYSCGKTKYMQEPEYSYQFYAHRGLTEATCQKYNIVTKVNDKTGEPEQVAFVYPFYQKIRWFGEPPEGQRKFIKSIGENTRDPQMFGISRFDPGGPALIITEGEYDAASAYQLLSFKFPVVSLRNGAAGARKDFQNNFEYINSFDKIYLCFDNDEEGKRAVQSVATLFDFNKVYEIKLTQAKDANEYLQKGMKEEFYNAFFSANRILPESIYSTIPEFKKILEDDIVRDAVSYPFSKLQEMTFGLRQGEFVLIKAMEGIGKTEILRALEYHILKNTDLNIGIIHMEETKSRTIKGVAQYELQAPTHLPNTVFSNEEILEAVSGVIGSNPRLHIYSHFDADDPEIILDIIRLLVSKCECKYIFLDHISRLTTAMPEGDERKVLDFISTRLSKMAADLDFGLVAVSHVNDEGQTRGSRNISKEAYIVLNLYRNLLAEDHEERNTTYLTVEKNRFTGMTGPAGALFFDDQTFCITEKLPEVPFDNDNN